MAFGRMGARGGFGRMGGGAANAASGTVVPFDPSMLGTKLVAWWDAGDLSVSPVASWTDKKSGIVASQAGANKPTWSATARNGKPGVIFGSTQQLNFTPTGLPSGSSYALICLAGQVLGAGSQIALSYGALAGLQVRGVGSSGGTARATNGAADHSTTFPWANNDAFIEWDYSSATDTYNVDAGTPQVGSLASPNTGTTTGIIGAYLDTSNQFIGTLQQILILGSAPTTLERQKIEGWESWHDGKAGSNLPVGHPYKNAPPTAIIQFLSGADGAQLLGADGAQLIGRAA